ncbi:MAG: serine hydrolase [Lachnospiraceae bacterium]|nr:serine hydrolase [Lachnospiraceae bacterium]
MDKKEALRFAEPFLVGIAFVLIVATSLFGLRTPTQYEGEKMTNRIVMVAGKQNLSDHPSDGGGVLAVPENSGEDQNTESAGDDESLPEEEDRGIAVVPVTTTENAPVSGSEPKPDESLSEGENYGVETTPLSATADEGTYYFSEADEDVISEYVVLIDPENHQILGAKGAKSKIYPASMTKILTLLVGVENMSSPEDPFTMTIDITDYAYKNDCSIVGFEVGETMTVKDLLYGTILPSGADAALGLATYVAGSQEEFVKLMNQKLSDLGISSTTHFTNCVGIHNEDHYSTPYDMAVILKAAMDNPLCREVLSAHTYTTSATEQHPEGITISNWFLRRIEDKDCGGTVIAGKTGFVVESKNCAASLAADADGHEYICVTAGSTSSWCCIYDQVAIYSRFFGKE